MYVDFSTFVCSPLFVFLDPDKSLKDPCKPNPCPNATVCLQDLKNCSAQACAFKCIPAPSSNSTANASALFDHMGNSLPDINHTDIGVPFLDQGGRVD